LVTANVTDVNGETRTVRVSSQRVGYHALELKATVDSKIEQQPNNITLSSENLKWAICAYEGQQIVSNKTYSSQI
jgi:hypothetical protein